MRSAPALIDENNKPLFAALYVAAVALAELGGLETSVRYNKRVSEPLGPVSYAAYGRQVALVDKGSVERLTVDVSAKPV